MGLGRGRWTSRRAGFRARLRAAVPAGVLATLTMDAAIMAAGRVAGHAASDRLGPDVIGRWASGLLCGRWQHHDASREPPRRGDTALGIATHYATGIGLTGAFLLVAWRRSTPRLGDAVAYGLATSALPLLVLFPSLGYGWLGLRSGEAARIDGIMLAGHLAFGLGIGLWTPRFMPHGGT